MTSWVSSYFFQKHNPATVPFIWHPLHVKKTLGITDDTINKMKPMSAERADKALNLWAMTTSHVFY